MCLEHKATTDPAHNCYYCQERCECIADDTPGCLGCDNCTDAIDWSDADYAEDDFADTIHISLDLGDDGDGDLW